MPPDASLSLSFPSSPSTSTSMPNDAFDTENAQDDPHQFYRLYSPPASGLPDIFVDRSVGAMATSRVTTIAPPNRKLQAQAINGSSRPQPASRPIGTSLRSASTPVKSTTTSPIRRKPTSSTIVAATSSQRGSVKDIANHFNQSSSSAGSPVNRRSRSNGLRNPSTTSRQSLSQAQDTQADTSRSPHKYHEKANTGAPYGELPQSRSATTSPLRATGKSRPTIPRVSTDVPLKSVNDMLNQRNDEWKPLFGEIIYRPDAASAKDQDLLSHRRSGSEGNMQSSNPDIVARFAKLSLEPSPLQDDNPFGTPVEQTTTSDQARTQSRSDLPYTIPASGAYHKTSHHLDRSISPIASPLSPKNRVKSSPSSRIPIPTRRYSAARPESTASQSPSSPSQGRAVASPSRMGRLQPTTYTAKDPTNHHPVTPSARRYDPRANKLPSNDQCLSAFISAPLPKKSPPLRSSRPRQPVSLSSSNSPRTDVFEQLTAVTQPDASPKEYLYQQDEPRRLLAKKHSGINNEILLERKSSIIQAMNSNDKILAHSRSISINSEREKGDKDKKSVEAGQILRADDRTARIPERPDVPTESPMLTLDTSNIPKNPSNELLTGTTDIEIEIESPIIGRSSDAKTVLPGTTYIRPDSATLSQSVTATHPSETDVSTWSKYAESMPQQQVGTCSMLDHVLQMRSDSHSTISHTEFGEGSRSQSSEFINVVLGATPTAPVVEESWPTSDRDGLDRSKHQSGWSEGSQSSPGSCSEFDRSAVSNIGDRDSDYGRRDSIFPDDSISVRHKSETIPSVPVFRGHEYPLPGQPALGGEAYTTVNKVLEQYYTADHVTPEMAHRFQQQMNGISPVLGQFEDWGSKGATQRYLERLIKESLGVKDEDSPHGSFHYSRNDEPSPNSGEIPPRLEEFYTGGTAIVYDSEERHGESMATQGADREAVKPMPPPKDYVNSRQLPTTKADRNIGNQAVNHNRGLAIDSIQSGTNDSNTYPPASVHSPHQPPPPPPPPPPSFHSHIPPPPPLPSSTSPSLFDKNPPSSIFPTAMPENANSRTRSYAKIIQRPQTDRSFTSAEAYLARPPVPAREPTSLSEAVITSRKETTASSDPDQKRLRQRWNLIKELIDTEFSFSSDMHVVENIYKGTSLSCKDIDEDDKKVLFGNSEQVVAFSEEFYSALKHAAAAVYTPARTSRWNVNRSSRSPSSSGAEEQRSEGSDLLSDENDRKTFIGEAFHGSMSKIEQVYGEYLRNHEFANQRLAKLQAMPNVEIWLKECGEQIQDITKAWSLDSLLVKPVQRLLKYPLLLKQLIDNTPEDHPDYRTLNTAFNDIKDASHRMNDSKKRGDLVDTFLNRKRKDSEPKFHLSKFLRSEKLGKANFSTTASYDDSLFNELVESWGDNYMGLQIIMRDYRFHGQELQRMLEQFIQYIGAMEAFLDVGQTSHYEIESTWRKFALAIREIAATALTEHKRLIRQKIIDKFTTLLHELDSYSKLIEKRKKRVGDYARYRTLKERGDKVDKKVQEGAEQYTALNETLKKAIPQLYKLCGKFCMATLRQFINLELKWQKAWEIKLKAVLGEPDLPKSFSAVVESFVSDFSYRESQVLQLGICNGSVLADIANFVPLSNLPGESDDGASSQRRSSSIQTGHRTTSVNSDTPLIPTPDTGRRQSGSRLLSPLGEDAPPLPSPTAGRVRASSALSNRGPLTPTSIPRPGHIPPRPSTSTDRSFEQYPYQSQTSLARSGHGDSAAAVAAAAQLNPQTVEGQRSGSLNSSRQSSSHHNPEQQQQQHLWPELEASTTPLVRFSGIFSSAMPMPDSPLIADEELPEQMHIESFLASEPRVLYVAVSLHQFKFDGTKTEAGFPYLGYVKGEIFDVVAEKGEIWLARNQDDPTKTIGWIWYRHFRPLS